MPAILGGLQRNKNFNFKEDRKLRKNILKRKKLAIIFEKTKFDSKKKSKRKSLNQKHKSCPAKRSNDCELKYSLRKSKNKILFQRHKF